MLKMIGILVAITVITLASCKKEVDLSANIEETIYVRSAGSDMPVFIRGNSASKVFILVLHGGPGGNGLEYSKGSSAEQLEEKYAMVYWDQRHQGNTHGHWNKKDLTIDLMVEDTHLLIQTLKKRYGQDISVFLMGHSWGGTLGTSYLIKENYQDELNGWIEIGGAHDLPMLKIELVKMIQEIGPQEITLENNTAKWKEMVAFVNTLDTTNFTTEDTWKLNGYAHSIEAFLPYLSTPESIDESLGEVLFLSPNNLLITITTKSQLPESFMQEVFATSLTNHLDKIKIPTLIQSGKYDFIVPPALAHSAFQKIGSSNKYLKIYEQSGHSPMNNEPDLFVKDLINFIEIYK